MTRNEVNYAFEILLEEIESVVDSLNEDGAETFRKGDYERAKQLIEDATRLTEFRKRVKDLQKEWQAIFANKAVKKKKTGKKYRKIQRGLRTPEDAYRIPILESLVELGGSGRISEVLDIVEKKMKAILNPYDYERLSSPPHDFRWRNTAQWCRNTMVNEGLLKSDSPRGIWEISEEGKKYLEENINVITI